MLKKFTGKKTAGLFLTIALAICGLAFPRFGAADAGIAWEEKFTDTNAPLDGQIFYEDRGSGKNGDAVMIKEIKDGVLRFGLKCDPARTRDRLDMLFGDCYWWKNRGGQWGPVDLKAYPIIEVKWRGDAFEFWYAVETAAGLRSPQYTWLTPQSKGKDAQGREWNINNIRIAADSSVPNTGTFIKLNGINFVHESPTKKDLETEIDYIRVRKLTDAEAVAEQNNIATFKDFPTGRWRGFDTFFPFGVYYAGGLQGHEGWCGDYEGAYGIYSRYGFNFMAANDEVELGRCKGQLSEGGLKDYIDQMRKHIEWARGAGIKLSADVRRMMEGRNPNDGYKQLLPLTEKLAKAFAGDDTVVSWTFADEPSAASLGEYCAMIRAIREADPLHRPELMVFNNTFAYTPYSSYLQVGYWDAYPGHKPWRVREKAIEYRNIAPGKPFWVVLQSFESRPPATDYQRTSDAETRLMAYLAIAEGAKGLVWYMGFQGGSGRDEGMATRTGNPQGEWMDTLKDLSRTLVPIGQQLLATEPADSVKVNVEQLDQPAAGRKLEVSVLKHRKDPVYYLVAANEDLERARKAKATLPAEMAKDGVGVYDLFSLDGKNLLEGNQFNISSLAGGDGRIYLVADANTYQSQSLAINCARALEDVRVLMPDLTLAKKWGLPIADVEQAMASCRAAAAKGDDTKAREQADAAGNFLKRVMGNNSELNVTRRMLEEIARELDEVSRIAEQPCENARWWTGTDGKKLAPNPSFLEQSKRYWMVGREYTKLYTRYLTGDKEGLGTEVFKLRMECLQMRNDILAVLRGRLESIQAPPTK